MKVLFILLTILKVIGIIIASIIGLILLILAVVLFVPVFFEYMQTGLVPRFPTLIVSGFSMLAAILAFSCGLILDTHAKNNRKHMEVQMNIIKLLMQK